MRVLKKSLIAGLLLALPLIAALVATGCSSGERKQAPPSPTDTIVAAVAVATPSPFPTARPTLDAATRFGAVHTGALPAVDEQDTWWARQLIPGSHLFLVFEQPGYLACDGCQFPPGDPAKPGRLALWNVDTGTVDEFRTLQPGDQLPATASDGHFLAWVEGCRNGMGDPWRLYAMDLTTSEIWHVDTDFATTSGDDSLSTCPSAIAITNGRLIYSTAIANLSGTYVDEVRTYDLAARSGSVLKLTGDIPPVNIGCSACGTSEAGLVVGGFSPAYVSGGQAFWIGQHQETCSSNNVCTTPKALYVTDVSNGNTRTLASGDVLDNGGVLRVLTGSDQGRDAAASRWWDQVEVTPNFVLWVDRPENAAMAYDLKSGDLIKLSDGDCSVDLLAADNNAIYWTCSGNQLHWVDLPQP